MRRADQVTGIIVLVFSLTLMEGSRRLPPSATFGPGAGFLPFWLGALMAVLSALLLVKACLQPVASADTALFPNRRVLIPVGATIGSLAAYILVLDRLGFLLGTGLLTAFLLGVVERERWFTTVLVAVLNAVGLYVVFHLLLGVSLPKSVLGF
ncbi:MAG: tripartite tricarboxylate transporter TctB family protein [candidate division NC10 bacterium]|nr:tripartite tricarboxylate transporter TctB family protein [candidate division NC10 bacterium]MBI4842350.1 tripartite tricarboxylate transporter TctB family protein [candidate division NC10 bacterium]